MSVYVTSHVWQHSRASGTELLVLLALADQADDAGWCFPGTAYVARKCRVHERTVQRALSALEGLGELERHARPGRSNYYRLAIAPPSTPVHNPVDNDPRHPVAPAGCHPTPDTRATPPPTPAPPITVKEPSRNRPAEPSAPLEGAALPGMPEPEQRWSGGVLVAAWVAGYRETHDGADPHGSLIKRLGASAKNAAKDTSDGDRDATLAVAHAAGRAARVDLVLAIADAAAGRLPMPGTVTPSSLSRNAAILARAAERNGLTGEGGPA